MTSLFFFTRLFCLDCVPESNPRTHIKNIGIENEIYMEKANVIITSFRILAIDQYVSFFLNERTYKGRIGRSALQEHDKNRGLA